MKRITREQLRATLTLHERWLQSNGTEGKQADLSWTDMSGESLHGADLRQANMAGANLAGSSLWDALLSDANLAVANLRGANLNRACLAGACLRGADLRSASMKDTVLTRAKFWFANLENAHLNNAYLNDADFYGANLANVVHSEVPVARNANFEKANLAGTKLGTCTDPSVLSPACACLKTLNVTARAMGYEIVRITIAALPPQKKL
jgi:uncharacterized protein YjbI with pentapeptide repeats